MPTQAEIEPLIALFNAGRYAELEAEAQRIVERFPESGRAWKILGTALGVQGKDALAVMHKAAQLLPEDASVLSNLGNAQQDAGQYEAATESYRRALKISPDFAAAHNNLGKALKNQGRFTEAMEQYGRALELEPDYADAYCNLGNAQQNLGLFKEAVASYYQALDINPDMTDVHNNLGNVFKDLGLTDAAIQSYRHALEINPAYTDAHNNLGGILLDIGQFDAAEASFRQALKCQPDSVPARSNLLFTLNYTATHATSASLGEARLYGGIVTKKAGEHFTAWKCAVTPDRLRVGLVSGDLRAHPVGHALESLLEQLDPKRVELIAYSTNPKEDELTARIQPYFAAWHPLYGKSDAEAAQTIHADGVHILLDLSGHTAHNRLPVFAWKPAPLQASWLGYFATTGVAEMDYLLTAEVAVPQAHRNHFTESIWHLPDIWLCFTPPKAELTPSVLPALEQGHLTLGCFQRLDKISDAALTAWGKILAALPQAQLRLANKQLGSQEVAEQFRHRMHQQGIDLARVHLQGAAESREEYLARHHGIDFILDTFPYPGVTTTCEALWMGVPTLSLAGETLVSRQGAGMLVPAGLGDWVANSEEEYVAKAIQLSSDLNQLAQLRANLRQQVLASPVYDAARFARNFETALWDMWRNRS